MPVPSTTPPRMLIDGAQRPFLPVPWAKAETLRNRLRERGIFATACYDARERAAGLEFLPDQNLDAALATLEQIDPQLTLPPRPMAPALAHPHAPEPQLGMPRTNSQPITQPSC